MPRKSRVDWDEVRRLASEIDRQTRKPKYTHQNIADRFGVSQQYISNGLRKFEEGDSDMKPWPWHISREHTKRPDELYKLMQSYRKHEAGHPVQQFEVRQADQLRKWAWTLKAAITYDPKQGFMWTSRREEDGDEMFVKR